MRIDAAWQEALRRGYPDNFGRAKFSARDWLFMPPMPETKEEPLSVERILEVVSIYYGVSVVDIKSMRRPAEIIRPRQVAMFLAKELTLLSLPKIAKKIGRRDHTTVLHGIRKIAALLATDEGLVKQVSALRAKLEEGAAG